MKVICKQTTSYGFDLREVTTILSNDFDYGFGGYGLEINKEYLVMGVLVYQNNNCLYYLIDTNGKPDWFPYLLFDIVDNSIPKNWFLKVNEKGKETNIYSLFGFKELCSDSDFYNQIANREESAMSIYFKRKSELENELAESCD